MIKILDRLSQWFDPSTESTSPSGEITKTVPSFSAVYVAPEPIPVQFQALIQGIAQTGSVNESEVIPYLCLTHKKTRQEVNFRLAKAFYESKQVDLAKIFIQRAWTLADPTAEILRLYKEIFAASGDVEAIKNADKRAGMAAAAQGNIDEALTHFNDWHYAHIYYQQLDKFEYDFDVIACVDRLALPYRFHHTNWLSPIQEKKIRLGYLLKGIVETNSILMKELFTIAKFHDQSRFDLFFFAPESSREIATSAQGNEWLSKFREYGYNVMTGPDTDAAHKSQRLQAVGKQIYGSELDILVTVAGLADFHQYFLTALRPAPIIMGLVMGPPPQFAAPSFDWCISWSKHPLMDTPVNCSIVDFQPGFAKRDDLTPVTKKDLNIPEHACVLMSGGRYSKFQDAEQWKAIIDLLKKYEHCHYVASGPTRDQIAFLRDILPPDIEPRVHCLGWRKDYLNLLCAADIVIDTFPSGGGQALFEAMGLGIPIVAHRNNYMRLYDQTDWSPAEDVISDSELLVPRGDFAELKRILSCMIENSDYRRNVGKRCQTMTSKPNPKAAVRDCEDIYQKVVQLHSTINNGGK